MHAVHDREHDRETRGRARAADSDRDCNPYTVYTRRFYPAAYAYVHATAMHGAIDGGRAVPK